MIFHDFNENSVKLQGEKMSSSRVICFWQFSLIVWIELLRLEQHISKLGMLWSR